MLAKDLGGNFSRRIVYRLKDGIVLVKKLGLVDTNKVVREEKQHLLSINKKPVGGEVELFD